jgi:PhoD-like phosphatase, N-terminal domain/PhoD-like phosphatase
MLSRRQFISAGAAFVFAPQAVAAPRNGMRLLRGGRFGQGVLSGDPTPRGITLLTIVDEVSGSGSLRLEVARDRDFRNVVVRWKLPTSGLLGHSVKARLDGLEPDERYYYRFETRDRSSPVGRFQTALPGDSNRPVRFAFFSCSEYTHGYYNAFEVMARDDIDFVVCLGDYVYGEAYNSVSGGTGVRNDRIGEPNPAEPGIVSEALTLADYRAKYALYPLRSGAARPARAVPARRRLGRPRGAGQLRRPGAWRRARRLRALVGGAATGGLPGVLRGDAVLPAAWRPRLPRPAPRPQRRPDHARPAPVPRRPAVRRRGRPAVPGVGPAAPLPRPPPVGLAQAPPAQLAGTLEGDRLADDDDAGEGARERVLLVRLMAGLSARA